MHRPSLLNRIAPLIFLRVLKICFLGYTRRTRFLNGGLGESPRTRGRNVLLASNSRRVCVCQAKTLTSEELVAVAASLSTPE